MSMAPGKERVKEARRQMYRQLITQAAEAVFAERGFRDAKMSDVAQEAGVSLKTLYANFEGKLDLYRAIQELRHAEIEQLTAIVGDGPALEVMMRRVATGIEYLLAHPNFLRVSLREGNAWSVVADPVTGNDAERWQETVRVEEEIIRRGIDEGTFVDERPDVMDKMIRALYQVQLADWLERGQEDDPALLISRIQRHVKRLLCASD